VRHGLRLCLFSLAALLGLAAGGLCASVDWRVEVGFDGAYTRGSWTPIVVDVHNRGPSQSGRITVPVKAHEYAQNYTLYAVPVDVPSGSRKRHRLYVPEVRYGQEIRLDLSLFREARGLENLTPVEPKDMLLVVLTENPSLLGFLQGARAPVGSSASATRVERYSSSSSSQAAHVALARVNWGLLPDSWLGWDGVDAVVVAETGFADAGEDELEALRQWIRLGGTLIVPGGKQAATIADGPLGDLLPMQVSGTHSVPDLAALEQWGDQPIRRRPALVAYGSPAEDAQVLLGDRDTPLVMLRPFDAGRVIMTGFDFTAEPVKYWDGQTRMWERMLSRAAAPGGSSLLSAFRGASRHYYPGGDMASTAAHSEAADLPPMWLMIGFLVAYIIVLIPVNYWIVTRLKRRELAWLTTPAIIVLFSLAAYGTGFALRGHRTLVNRLAVAELEPGQGLARALGYVGVFSPAKMKYDLALEGSAAGVLDTEVGSSDKLTVLGGPRPKVTDLAVNMWSTRVVQVEFLADFGGGISGHLEFDGTDLFGHVRNDTGRTLKSVGIVRNGRMGSTKRLAPGQEADVNFIRTTDVGSTYPSGPQMPLGERAIVAIFGSEGPMHYYPGRGSGRLREAPRVVALCDEQILPVTLIGRNSRSEDATVIAAQLPVRLRAGKKMAIPRWLVRRRVIATDGAVWEGDEWDGFYVSIGQGSATFEFDLPVGPGGALATSLQVIMQTDYSGMVATPPPGGPGMRAPMATVVGTGPQPPLSASVFDHRAAEWVPLTFSGPAASVPNPADCMTEDGQVLVKVEVPTTSVNVIELALDARVDSF